MSPLAKQSQPPITDAQAWRWIKRHYEAKYDTKIDRNYGFGRYSAIAPKVGKFVADLQALQAAILDPTSPGATDVMAGVIDLIGTDGTTALGDLDSDIESYGEAIAWGLRGEPQADLDAFAEKHEQHQREYEEAKIRCSTPEFIEGCTQRWLTHCTDALINAVRGDVGSDSKQRPLTTEERAGLLESLREAFEQLAPAKAEPVYAEAAARKRSGKGTERSGGNRPNVKDDSKRALAQAAKETGASLDSAKQMKQVAQAAKAVK